MIRRLILVLIAAATGTALAACNPKVPAPADGKPTSADSDPHWVIQQKPPAKVALVFVHGVTGDMIGTWTAANGSKFWVIVFVAHSMGGLVVMRELVTHHEELDKVPVVMFYGVPRMFLTNDPLQGRV